MDIKRKLLLWSGGIISSYSSQYQSVLDKGTAIGATLPSSAERTKQDTKMRSYVSNGLFSAKDVFYNFRSTDGSGSKEFACINWKDPSNFLISIVGDITWSSLGFISATNGYLNTGFDLGINGVNYVQNSASFIFDISGGVANTSPILRVRGFNGTDKNINIYPKFTGESFVGINDSGETELSFVTGFTGLYHTYRKAASGAGALGEFKDGTSVATVTTASTGVPSGFAPVCLFAYSLGQGGSLNITPQCFGINVGSLEIGSDLFAKAAIQNTIYQTYIS